MTAEGTERNIRVGCVLLASGASVRFGEENKLLADLQGRPLVAHVLSTLCALLQADGPKDKSSNLASSFSVPVGDTDTVTCCPVVVCEDAEVNRLARDAGFDTLCAPHPLQSDTVRDGLSYLLSRHAGSAPLGGCMFVAADQPFLTAESIRRLLAQFAAEPSRPCRLAYREAVSDTSPASTSGAATLPSRGGPVSPEYTHITPGNPVIFPAAMFDALLSLTGDQGGGILLRKKKPAFVFVSDKRELLDIDTIADLRSFP